MISCKEKFSNKEDCYKQMYLSPSQCCQILKSNMEKDGFGDEIGTLDFRRLCCNILCPKYCIFFTILWVYFFAAPCGLLYL